MQHHRRFYEIAGITVQVESDLPFTDTTFNEKFAGFRVDGPGTDTVVIRHHFEESPPLDLERGQEVYRRPPWAVYRGADSWVYEGIAPRTSDPTLYCVAVFNADHTQGDVYDLGVRADWWRAGGLHALTLFPTDQIVLARLLADRRACLMHSGGVVLDDAGLLFVGHSDAGKSTTIELVREAAPGRVTVLCDDRIIVRRWSHGFRIHGTWSHGDVADVSSASAPLRAVLFLEQASRNELVPLIDRKLIWRRLLATLIRPLVSADWWLKEMDVLEAAVDEVPCYRMRFDRSGAIVPALERLTASRERVGQ